MMEKKSIEVPISHFLKTSKGQYILNPDKFEIPDFQRPDTTWETSMANSFISTLINEPYFIPELHLGFIGKKGIVLDGLQRITSIINHLNKLKEEENTLEIEKLLKIELSVKYYLNLANEEAAHKIFKSLNKGKPLTDIDLQRGSGTFCQTLKYLRNHHLVIALLGKKNTNIQDLEKRIASIIYLSKNTTVDSNQDFSSQYTLIKNESDWNSLCLFTNPKQYFNPYFILIEKIIEKNFSLLKNEDSSALLFLAFVMSLELKHIKNESLFPQILKNVRFLLSINFFDTFVSDIENNNPSGFRTRNNRLKRIKLIFSTLKTNPSKSLKPEDFNRVDWVRYQSSKIDTTSEFFKTNEKLKEIREKSSQKIKDDAEQSVRVDKKKESAIKTFASLIKNEHPEPEILVFLKENPFLINLSLGVDVIMEEHIGQPALAQMKNYTKGDFLCVRNGGIFSLEFKSPKSYIFVNEFYRKFGPCKINPELIHASLQVFSNGYKYVEFLNKDPYASEVLRDKSPQLNLGSMKVLMGSILVIGKNRKEEIKKILQESNFEVSKKEAEIVLDETWTFLQKILNVQIYTYQDVLDNLELVLKNIKKTKKIN